MNLLRIAAAAVVAAAAPCCWPTLHQQFIIARESKTQDIQLLPITSPNVDRFSKFFRHLTQQQDYNKLIIKDLTTPGPNLAGGRPGVRLTWGVTKWETAATLQCRLLGGARRFSAHGEERGGTYHCGRPPRACYFFGFWASCGGLSWISASFCALVNQRWAIPVYEILVLYYVFRILFVFGIQYLKCKRESICVLIFQMIQTKYFVFNITSTIRSNKTVTWMRCWS